MKDYHRTLGVLIFISGLVAALFSLLPVLSVETIEFRGYEIIVGGEVFNLDPFGLGSVASAQLPFSFTAAAAYGLPLAGGLIVLFKPHYSLIAASLLIISVFLFIMLPDSVQVVYTIAGTEQATGVDWHMEIGYIGGLTASSIAALLTIIGIMKRT